MRHWKIVYIHFFRTIWTCLWFGNHANDEKISRLPVYDRPGHNINTQGGFGEMPCKSSCKYLDGVETPWWQCLWLYADVSNLFFHGFTTLNIIIITGYNWKQHSWSQKSKVHNVHVSPEDHTNTKEKRNPRRFLFIATPLPYAWVIN